MGFLWSRVEVNKIVRIRNEAIPEEVGEEPLLELIERKRLG